MGNISDRFNRIITCQLFFWRSLQCIDVCIGLIASPCQVAAAKVAVAFMVGDCHPAAAGIPGVAGYRMLAIFQIMGFNHGVSGIGSLVDCDLVAVAQQTDISILTERAIYPMLIAGLAS